MKKYETLLVEELDSKLFLSLNRPERKNAFNEKMITELTEVFNTLNSKTKIIIIQGSGDTFCSGGDLDWMKKSLTLTGEENYLDAKKLSDLFLLIDQCSIPVIGVVKRFALGGGVGVVSVCDYVLAEQSAIFSLSEVKLGLIPACIGPFVLKKIGESWSRALFLSAERFDAVKAKEIGLIHEFIDGNEQLNIRVQKVIEQMLSSSPQALKTAKLFLRKIRDCSTEDQNTIAAKTLADIRITPEAQEGVNAFLEKRKPKWD